MTNVEALRALYTALGGTASDVANCTTIVEVLNAIAAIYDGDDDAVTNPDAIANIAAVAGSIAPSTDVLGSLIDRSVTTIEIPDGVTVIGQNAFANCTNLSNVTIPNSVTKIDTNAFYLCEALTSITIPNSVTDVEMQSLAIGADRIDFPNSVKNIEDMCIFGSNTIKTITIGSGIEYIGSDAFTTDYGSVKSITINKPENSIADAPWGAIDATVTWTG